MFVDMPENQLYTFFFMKASYVIHHSSKTHPEHLITGSNCSLFL